LRLVQGTTFKAAGGEDGAAAEADSGAAVTLRACWRGHAPLRAPLPRQAPPLGRGHSGGGAERGGGRGAGRHSSLEPGGWGGPGRGGAQLPAAGARRAGGPGQWQGRAIAAHGAPRASCRTVADARDRGRLSPLPRPCPPPPAVCRRPFLAPPNSTPPSDSTPGQDDVPESILPQEPEPGAVVWERALTKLGGTEMMLSNGMRVVSTRKGGSSGLGGGRSRLHRMHDHG
jgi:hypothetical protein